MHFIGPSGVGKTLLAEFVAKSFYHARHCRFEDTQMAAVASSMARPMIQWYSRHVPSAAASTVLCIGTNAASITSDVCGVVYLAFTRSDDDPVALLRNFLKRVAAQYKRDPEATMVLIVDEFNHCVGPCEERMARIVHDGVFDGVPLSNAVVVLTSDLNEVGLRLSADEPRKDALRRIHDKAREHWGPDSLWTKVGMTVPLLPFTDAELAKLVDVKLGELERIVRDDIEVWLRKYERERIEGEATWKGQFTWAPRTRQRIVDSLYKRSLAKNARAVVVDMWVNMRGVAHEPESIGKRLTDRPCTSEETLPPRWFGSGRRKRVNCARVANIELRVEDGDEYALDLVEADDAW